MKSEHQLPKTKKIPGRWRLLWMVLICCAGGANGASFPCIYRNNVAAYVADNPGKYARHKHEYLLANYPNYAAANVDIEAFTGQYGADVYLAAAVMYEAFMEEWGEDPDGPYLWQLAMEVFSGRVVPDLTGVYAWDRRPGRRL